MKERDRIKVGFFSLNDTVKSFTSLWSVEGWSHSSCSSHWITQRDWCIHSPASLQPCYASETVRWEVTEAENDTCSFIIIFIIAINFLGVPPQAILSSILGRQKISVSDVKKKTSMTLSCDNFSKSLHVASHVYHVISHLSPPPQRTCSFSPNWVPAPVSVGVCVCAQCVFNQFLLPCFQSLMVFVMCCSANQLWKLWAGSLQTVLDCGMWCGLTVTTTDHTAPELLQSLFRTLSSYLKSLCCYM